MLTTLVGSLFSLIQHTSRDYRSISYSSSGQGFQKFLSDSDRHTDRQMPSKLYTPPLRRWSVIIMCTIRSCRKIWCHHAQMSAWQGSAVPCRLLHTGHRCCWQAASQVGHTANDGGATTSAIHCWPLSIRCARPHGLELLAGRPPCTAGL